MKKYKFAILAVLSPVMISTLVSCGRNDLSMLQANLNTNILTWDESKNAINYEIKISQNNQLLKSIYKQKEELREVNLDEYQIPFGLTTIEVIAYSQKHQRSTSVQYIESTLRNLHVHENSYTETNPFEGHSISAYHQGIEFILNTTLNPKEISGKELTGTNEEMLETYEEIEVLYNRFLTENGNTKQELAELIGDDLIVSYYYLKNNQPIHFYTKQKYWSLFLNYKTEDDSFTHYGDPTGYIGKVINPNVYRTNVNFMPSKIDFTPLSDNTLYTEVTVIKNGMYASRTVEVKIKPVLIQSIRSL